MRHRRLPFSTAIVSVLAALVIAPSLTLATDPSGGPSPSPTAQPTPSSQPAASSAPTASPSPTAQPTQAPRASVTPTIAPPPTAPPTPGDPGRSADGREGVVLPDGRVLPPLPAAADVPSIHAEMLEEHGARVYRFEEGGRPTVDLPDQARADASSGDGDGDGDIVLANWDPRQEAAPTADALPNGFRREVHGFLPYWMLDATQMQYMRYDRVTTIAYFSVGARADGYLDKGTSTGPSGGWAGWTSAAMTDVINKAHARGVRVILTVTMMNWDGGTGQQTLLNSSTYRSRLVQEIVSAVRSRNADGVNLDFEPVGTRERDVFTSFVRQLKAGLKAAGVGSYLSVCTMAGAATWATGYDVAGLTAAGAADHLFVMGYDYSWSGSDRAGGVAPMESSYQIDVTDTVADYLSETSGSKIIWGVPYYGRSWPTETAQLNSYTRPDTASSYTRAWHYTAGLEAAEAYGRRWDPNGAGPWFTNWDAANNTQRQGYYDDAASLAIKYDLINSRNLAGTGMWTLLMDQGRNELWDLLRTKFGADGTPPSVTSTSPANGATGVSTRTAVSVTFNEPVSGVNTDTFRLRDAATNALIPTTVTYDAATRTATLQPSSPLGGTGRRYKAGVGPGIRDASGNSMPSWTIWYFTTVDVKPPAVTRVSPVDGATNVTTGASVSVTFSEPVTGVSTASFGLRDTTSWTLVPATVTYNSSTRTATLRPSAALVPGHRHRAVVTADVKDAAGNSLPWTASYFTATSKAQVFSPPRALHFAAGAHTGYRFDASGAATSSRTYTLDSASSASTSQRALVPGRSGVWFYVTNGAFAGHWVRESASLYLPGMIGQKTYASRSVAFDAGTHTGYRFSSSWTVTATKSYTLTRDSYASSTRSGYINGRLHFYITNGVWAGYWVRASDAVRLE